MYNYNGCILMMSSSFWDILFVGRRMTGNLYIMLHIGEKHGIWRDGLHLYSNISIDYTEAILGTIVRVS